MNRHVLDYLNNIKNKDEVNALLVSAFLIHKNINVDFLKNKYISNIVMQVDYNKLKKFIELLNSNEIILCFEELLEFFEFVISPSEKIVNGAIYTPKNIRNYITREAFAQYDKNHDDAKVVDIACGCGGFLIDASKELKNSTKKSYKEIFENNIFGVDIQPYSCERTQILLSLLAIVEGEDEEYFKFNIYQGDSLNYNWGETKFDIILGNPPYVCSRNMDKSTKESIANWSSCSTGHPDLYIPFFQIGNELLSKDGILGYITVNSFLNSINGRSIREYFAKQKALLKIIDFKDEQIFKDRLTYTCIFFLQKTESESIYYADMQQSDLLPIRMIKFESNSYSKLNAHQGWHLKNSSFVEDIESVGVPFEKLFQTKSGIATLKNHIYIFAPAKEDDDYYFINDETPIEKGICKNIVNSNRLNKNSSLDHFMEKIIFPYTHDDTGRAYLIDENTMKGTYPATYEYLQKNRETLATRDKGEGKYPTWYAFGRTQSLEKKKEKLFFPHMAKKGFSVVYNEDDDLYLYNGMVAYGSKEDLLVLKKILESNIFWDYIQYSAKPYTSGYFGIGKNTIKNFGIYQFSKEEREFLLGVKNKNDINAFIEERYMKSRE